MVVTGWMVKHAARLGTGAPIVMHAIVWSLGVPAMGTTSERTDPWPFRVRLQTVDGVRGRTSASERSELRVCAQSGPTV